MVSKLDIEYELDIEENISASEIKEMYDDTVNVWLTGSGGTDGSHFSYILQYKNHKRFETQMVPGATANQAYIHGAIHAVKCINKPIRICLIVPTALGLETAFKGKGVNSDLINTLYNEISDRKCKLTEVRVLNGADLIKSYIVSNSNDEKVMSEFNKSIEDKEDRKYRYKEFLYGECIKKVLEILKNEKLDNDVIEQIKNIKP